MKRVGGFMFDAYRNAVDIASIVLEGLLEAAGDAVDKAMDVWGREDDE